MYDSFSGQIFRIFEINFLFALQFHRHHSYFRKDFQILFAVKEGEI